jgi:hypothetical protein
MLNKLKEFDSSFLNEMKQLIYNKNLTEDDFNRQNFYEMFLYIYDNELLNESYSHLIKDSSYFDLTDLVIVLEKKYGDDIVKISSESLKELKKMIDEELSFDELNEMVVSGNIPVNIVDDKSLITKDDKIYTLSKLFGYKIKKPMCKKEKVKYLDKIKISPLYGYLRYYLSKNNKNNK